MPRALTPVMVDGGTRLHVTFPRLAFPLEVARTVAALRDDPKVRRAHLPTGRAGARLGCSCIVGGASRHILTFHLPDRCWFRLNVETREVHLQLKAKDLWAWGYEDSATRWLTWVQWMCTGVVGLDVWQAHRYGWKLTGAELCADFTELDFVREDAPHFIGGKLSGDYNPGDPIETWGSKEAADGRTPVETIMVGRRTSSPVSLCIYDKRRQIQSVKAGDGSTYHPAWVAGGWDGASGVTRVELRLMGRGLNIENEKTGEVIDATMPRTLAGRAAVDTIWQVACHKRRLTVPDSATRRERRRTDPRWNDASRLPVANTADPHGWRQVRAVQAGTHAERVRRSQRATLRGLARWAALHGLTPEMFDDAREMLRAVAMIATPAEVAETQAYMAEYAEDQELIADEIDIASERLRDRWRGAGRGRRTQIDRR